MMVNDIYHGKTMVNGWFSWGDPWSEMEVSGEIPGEYPLVNVYV